METFARSTVEKFLGEHMCVYYGVKGEKSIWVKGNIIIQLPMKGRIDYDMFEFIATVQLEIAYWEFDYWLGENT